MAVPSVGFGTYRDRMIVLKRIVPGHITWPKGLPELIDNLDARPHQNSDYFFDEGMTFAPPNETYRQFVHASLATMGLVADYDPKTKSLNVDFDWRRNDPRSHADLKKVIDSTRPQSGYNPAQDDAWWQAFDGYLSKPTIFPDAWKLRFLDGNCSLGKGTIAWAGDMSDENGLSHWVMINYHPQISLPGAPGTFFCYVFDEDGKFEFGLSQQSGHDLVDVPQIELDPSGSKLAISYYAPGDKEQRRFVFGYLAIKDDGPKLSLAQPDKSIPWGKVLYRIQGGSDSRAGF